MILFVTIPLLFGILNCVPLRYQPPKKSDYWWFDMEATVWDDKGPQLENSPYYNTFRQVDKQLDMYSYAQHVGKINRGQYYNPELNLPGHRAFGHKDDYNSGDLKSGAFRHSPQGQKVVADQVHVDLGMATSTGDIITLAPGHSINTDGTILVETNSGQHPCASNPCARVFPKNEATCVAIDTTTAKCTRVIIDGGWSSWQCTADCTQVRRTCNNPPPSFRGADCVGESIESRSCEGGLCGCPLGWNPFGSHCYIRHGDTVQSPNMLSWADAKAECEKYSANLASITSVEEGEFIYSSFGTWIGGHKNAEGEWIWIDGSTWGTFLNENWGAVSGGVGDCVAWKENELREFDCAIQAPYTCKMTKNFK